MRSPGTRKCASSAHNAYQLTPTCFWAHPSSEDPEEHSKENHISIYALNWTLINLN